MEHKTESREPKVGTHQPGPATGRVRRRTGHDECVSTQEVAAFLHKRNPPFRRGPDDAEPFPERKAHTRKADSRKLRVEHPQPRAGRGEGPPDRKPQRGVFQRTKGPPSTATIIPHSRCGQETPDLCRGKRPVRQRTEGREPKAESLKPEHTNPGPAAELQKVESREWKVGTRHFMCRCSEFSTIDSQLSELRLRPSHAEFSPRRKTRTGDSAEKPPRKWGPPVHLTTEQRLQISRTLPDPVTLCETLGLPANRTSPLPLTCASRRSST